MSSILRLRLHFAKCLQYRKSYITALLGVELTSANVARGNRRGKICAVFGIGNNTFIAARSVVGMNEINAITVI
jgi:hypothetical protein